MAFCLALSSLLALFGHMALWSHSPLSSRHKGTQAATWFLQLSLTKSLRSWRCARARITEGRLGFPLRELTYPRGRYTNKLPWNWCHLKDIQMANVDLEKAQPMPSQAGDRSKLYQWRGGVGNQENLTWNTAEDYSTSCQSRANTGKPAWLSVPRLLLAEGAAAAAVCGWRMGTARARLCFSGVPSPVWCIQLWWKIREEPCEKIARLWRTMIWK